MSFDKSAFLSALKPSITAVQLDGFGTVHLRQITVAENDAIRASTAGAIGAASDFGLRLLAAAMVDEDGAPVLTPDELPALRAGSGTKIDALIRKVLELNGFVGEATAAKN